MSRRSSRNHECVWIQQKEKVIHESWVWMQSSNDTRSVHTRVCVVDVCVWGGCESQELNCAVTSWQQSFCSPAVLITARMCVCSYLVKPLRQFFQLTNWRWTYQCFSCLNFVLFFPPFCFSPMCPWWLHVSLTRSFCVRRSAVRSAVLFSFLRITLFSGQNNTHLQTRLL